MSRLKGHLIYELIQFISAGVVFAPNLTNWATKLFRVGIAMIRIAVIWSYGFTTTILFQNILVYFTEYLF